MNKYKFVVTYNDIMFKYAVQQISLTEAIKQVKTEFGRDFNTIGSNINIKLEESDVCNHIDEILNCFI